MAATKKIKATPLDPDLEAALLFDPSLLLDEVGFNPPLDWQRQLLRTTSDRILLNAHRQSGKSRTTSVLATFVALAEPGALILVVSASQRQSTELFRKVVRCYKDLGTPVPLVEDAATTLALENGSRVVSLPDSIDTIVGYSGPRLIILDEAARISDETYVGVRPMLLESRGRLIAMSTPKGRRGWFYSAWHNPAERWERIEFRASENPRVDPEFLAEELAALGPLWYQQEYECAWLAGENQYFSNEAIEGAFDDETVEPIFEESSFV